MTPIENSGGSNSGIIQEKAILPVTLWWELDGIVAWEVIMDGHSQVEGICEQVLLFEAKTLPVLVGRCSIIA